MLAETAGATVPSAHSCELVLAMQAPCRHQHVDTAPMLPVTSEKWQATITAEGRHEEFVVGFS